MKMTSSLTRILCFALPLAAPLGVGTGLLATSACTEARSAQTVQAPVEEAHPRTALPLTDQPLETYREELLGLAFRAASKFPLVPHVKNRSRAQQAVVDACLELDRPLQARGYIEAIENWRRGAGLADLAFYCAEKGDAADARTFLELAEEAAASTEQDEEAQGWRTDRIRVRMAQALVLLGDEERIDELEAGVVDSELGKIEVARARTLSEEAFDEQLAALDDVILSDSMDRVRNALAACNELFGRFYANEARRAATLAQVRSTRGKVPAQVFFDALTGLADTALEHGDSEQGLALVEESQGVVESVRWLPRARVPLSARLAVLRYRAGQQEQGRNEALAALAFYDESETAIVDIYRAGALRPLAEAFEVMDDRETALTLYRRAIEEGARNPNARPRADDLSATCISMALLGIEPGDALRARMYQIFDGLESPW